MKPTVDIEDSQQLLSYLRVSKRIGPNERPRLRPLGGGVSNKTIWLGRENGEQWVLKQALPKLRVKADWYSDPSRIRIEANALRYLPALTPRNNVPALLFEDPEQSLLAMEAVPEPNKNWKEELLQGTISEESVKAFGQLLGHFHRESYRRKAELEIEFENRDFFQTLRLEPYYEYCGIRIPEASRFLRDLMTETLSRRDSLVHGDYSPKNILVHRGKLILLDHEVLHFGDPAFDWGFSLTHLLSKAHHLPRYRETMVQAARLYSATYLKEIDELPWRRTAEINAVKHTVACLLARTSGRSPLEYLTIEEKEKQKAVALSLMAATPSSIEVLIKNFEVRINQ